MEVFVDGASAGNPGPSGAGIVLKAEGIYEQFAIPLAVMTNHEAEFIAIKLGLEEAIKKQATLIRLYSDSKVAIEAIHKRHAKNPLFKPHLEAILEMADSFELFFAEWRNVSQNKQADQLARQAIKNRSNLESNNQIASIFYSISRVNVFKPYFSTTAKASSRKPSYFKLGKSISSGTSV